MGPDAIILVFWKLTFKPTFLVSSFTFINRLLNSSLTFFHKVDVICISEVIDIFPSKGMILLGEEAQKCICGRKKKKLSKFFLKWELKYKEY